MPASMEMHKILIFPTPDSSEAQKRKLEEV